MNVVCFITKDWETYQRRPHYTALAHHAKVLCVTPPVGSLFTSARWIKWLRSIKDTSLHRDGNGDLFVFRPRALMPYGMSYRSPVLSQMNRLSLAASLAPILKRLDIRDFVSFAFFPYQDCVIRLLNPALQCYELVDECTTLDHADTDLSDPAVRRKAVLEQRILGSVDVVFATSKKLWEVKRKFNPNTYFVPNAADYDHFHKAFEEQTPVATDIRQIPSPRIGFVGNLAESVDIQLLDRLAERHRNWSIVIIGAMNIPHRASAYAAFQELQKQQNVYYLGWRDYESLPAYLKGLDVCLMPYLLTDRLRFSHPNKMYQYLATGKPVVSTDFPEVNLLKEVIDIAQDHEQFDNMIQLALRQHSTSLIESRLRVARANTVQVRAEQKIEIIREHLCRAAASESQP